MVPSSYKCIHHSQFSNSHSGLLEPMGKSRRGSLAAKFGLEGGITLPGSMPQAANPLRLAPVLILEKITEFGSDST